MMRVFVFGLFFVYGLHHPSLFADQKYFNDFNLRSNFQKGLEKLLDGNQTVSLYDLKNQLTQKHSKVELGEIPLTPFHQTIFMIRYVSLFLSSEGYTIVENVPNGIHRSLLLSLSVKMVLS